MDVTMFQKTVKYSGEVIFIQPLCEFFGIDYLNQRKIINRNPMLKKMAMNKSSLSIFGDQKERMAITKKGFIAWVLQINERLVFTKLKDKLMQYKEMIFDWLLGSIEAKQENSILYARQQKLKRIHAKVGAEIKRNERLLAHYVEDHLCIQSSLFKSNPSLNETN